MALPDYLLRPNREVYRSANYVVLDFETTNVDKGSSLNRYNRLVVTGWKYDGTFYQNTGSEYEQDLLVDHINSADFVVAQNVQFEIGWLERCGADVFNKVFYDTMLGEYVILGNRQGKLDLDTLALKYGGSVKGAMIKKMMAAGICPSEMPRGTLLKYNREDVENTEKVFLAQRERLYADGLVAPFYNRCMFAPVLYDMRRQGMALDKERVNRVYAKVVGEHQELQRKLDQFTGGINFRSPKQVAEFMYDTLGFEEHKGRDGEPLRTAGGARLTNKDSIEKLKAVTKEQKSFKKLKKEMAIKDAELTKTLNKFKECVDNGDLLYANFNQTVTRTHRLSSSGLKYSVQFQNFPRKFKPLFTARRKGWLIVESDAAQLEFRVAAHLGRDAQAAMDIANKVDVHSFTASIIGVSRQEAKAHTFKPLFGGRSGTPREQKYYKAFREKYVDITATQDRWIGEAVSTKKVRAESGLIFYFPDTKVQASGYVTNTPSICNYPVQSFATAEIIPIAVTFLWHRIREARLQAFLVNTIHDSAIAEVPPEEVESYEEIAHLSFTDDVYNFLRDLYDIDFTIPLEAEVKSSRWWANTEEWEREWLM